ncbi:amino acid permease [Orrella daihaiensis]|uniref:Amino acid permease n=1 Tax=Orrella daihaiensis TaxID=2782176 RepID=A0ABY4AIN7_9BURK|nr:amino acid permease [Orrella daihaiensis]UOD50162.1 amino acid permease [Orrella daihaiensis]
MFYRFFHKKPLPNPTSESAKQQLPRTISLTQLTLVGVGSTLGTGIFFAMAETVPIAGPAVIISFLLAAITGGLTALCYAEVSSALPVSGASYTFTYITMGEGAAVLVAACLLLEWGIAGAAVAVGWSTYLNQLIEMVTGSAIPEMWRTPPLLSDVEGLEFGGTGVVNLPAIAVVWLCTLLLLRGSQESARLNAWLTITKVSILLLFVAMSLTVFRIEHFAPFMPFGISGVSAAAAIIFFSFVGLDSVVNASEEAINPQKNIPRAICTALLIVTTVYVLVAVSGLGVQTYDQFVGVGGALPAILMRATESPATAIMLATGAVISIFSVTFLTLFGQARIYFAMARDGLLPKCLARTDPKTHCPKAGTLLAGLAITPLAGFFPSHVLWAMVSLGTLMVFIAVAISLILLRQRKHTPPEFRVPLYPATPIISIAACIYLIANLSGTVFTLFLLWLSLALLFYAAFGQRGAHKLAQHQGSMAT